MLTGCQGTDGPGVVGEETREYTVPCSDGRDISFDFDMENQQFTITDKRNQKVWTSAMQPSYYNHEELDESHLLSILSLFSMTYADSEHLVTMCRNTDEDMKTEYVREEDTVVAHAVVQSAGISFDIRFRLQANTLIVTVPADSIREETDKELVTIEVLPFFGASLPTEDGYILYPDGSGALYEFGQQNKDSASSYQKQVYCDYFYDYDEYLRGVQNGIKRVMLPVFGIKQGENGILAVITKGEADTAIRLSPSGYIYDAARISAIFNYRYSYEVQAVDTGVKIVMQEDDRAQNDFEVQYTFLSDEQATYSGMAQIYRQFLLENDMIRQSDAQTPVSLDYLISLQKPVMFWTENVMASTFESGEEVLKKLGEVGISDVRLNLLGWQSKGYNVYPSHFPVSGVSGGKAGLKKLLTKSDDLKATISLNDNFVLAQSNQGGYSKRNDLAYSTQNKIYVDNDEMNFLMDFRSAKNQFVEKWVDEALALGVDAINLDDIARVFYANAAKQNPLRRAPTVSVINQLLKTADEKFSYIGIGGGNQYGLAVADFLYDIPDGSSEDPVFTRDVPFYQIVVHGLIPYTPEVPGNFSDDYQNTVLNWAEYGFTPYYSISASSATDLKECYNEGVLVSGFEDVEEKIVETVKQFQTSFSSLSKVAMVSHELKENGLTQVVYENGTTVLINYSADAVVDNEVTVAAKSFVVVQK